MKINYNTNVFGDDDIIKAIEGGNVNLPLRGTLIQGSQNLFGVKTELQFGYLRLTAIAAQQKNRKQNLAIQGGSQVQYFNIPIDQYDENRHFFLSHYNRNTFEEALKELPLINSQFSITKIEVWVSNERNEDREVRQIIALADLGESDRLNNPASTRIKSVSPDAPRDITGKYRIPANEVNDLYERLLQDTTTTSPTRAIGKVVSTLENDFQMVQGRDFVKRSAKRLQPSEYTFNPKLGTISINNLERQQVLGVAFTYFYNGKGPFQVGEFAENVPVIQGVYNGNDTTGQSTTPQTQSQARVLYTKMLKSTIQTPLIPLFDLMMRNVYSVGAYVTNPQDLRLDIVYQDASAEKAEKRALPEKRDVPLLRLLNLDRLNSVGDPQPDGQFDFIPDVTINTRNGRIMFPVLEPFGKSLKARLDSLTGDPSISAKYTYQELYDSTLFRAQERQEKNRFLIKGSVKSTASNRIQLNAFGLRPGAVRVTAGAYQLLEGVDFSVDYGTSTLTVLNPSYVAPNIPLNVSYEDNALFGFQTRTMLGIRADYSVKKNFNVGATFMNLFEVPYTKKVNFGDDPINNKVYGVDLNFTEDAPWLTKLVDKIPFIQTKEPSKITMSAEGAFLQPGHAKAINVGADKGGVVYMDDFEGSSSPFSLMSQVNAWQLASVPQRNDKLFPEAKADSNYSGVNRANLNWYRVDQFVRDKAKDANSPYVISIAQTEVFPSKDVSFSGFNYLPTFDITYHPKERGPYNFDIPNGYTLPAIGKISEGLRGDGSLNKPETRWGAIMRGLTTTDFEAANVEYLDFWVLDPFLDPTKQATGGNLYIHLGDVSEDILKDSRKMYENGLPSPTNTQLRTDPSVWGRVPRTEIPLPNSFSANEEERKAQDIGLDGLNDAEEAVQFQKYLQKIQPNVSAATYDKIQKDPSNDDFTYYNDPSFAADAAIVERYRRFNGLEGNSAQTGQAVQSATNLPDAEDINHDNSFEENEAYYSYKIPLTPASFSTTTNKFYIESVDGEQSVAPFLRRKWHHFRVPIDAFDSKFGSISDFRSIRFMRMVMKDFDQDVTLRFAKLDLIRNQWRRYKRDVSCKGFDISNSNDQNGVELLSVNIEENSKKQPFNYVIPPGIEREVIPNAYAANARQNEQSLALKFDNLTPCKGKAAFKLFSSDLRIYERLKMFVHAENTEGVAANNKMCVFMRVGSDFEKNYYEYEIPLQLSNPRTLPASSLTDPNGYASAVWLKANTFDFAMSLFTKVKLERNAKNVSLNEEYTFTDPDNPQNKVKVRGNPDIGLVKGVMVGVYNKDDVSHNLELWINELRCTGLNENTGGAALARIDMKLADFGNVALAGNYLGIGYGGIDQRVQQRSREKVIEYSVNANLELGKFFPASSGIHIPFNIQHSENIRTPEYDPYDLDLKLKDKLNLELDGAKRDSIRAVAETVQIINGYSFTNVRKDRTGGGDRKPMPWDISNFSASYAHTNVERHDPLVETDAKESFKGGLDYQYSREPFYISPFKKLIKNEKVGKYLKLITDFHFNPIPNSVGVNTILDRQLNKTTYRFSGDDAAYNTFFIRRFSWDRNYTMQWDLTRSLKLNFDAKNFAIIDELPDFKPDGTVTSVSEKTDYINTNLRDFGRTKRYDQNINVNYTLPTRNIPFMDWVQVRGTYGASYGWEAASRGFEAIGNNINNRQNRQASADLNFTTLYNNSKYLKKIQTAIFAPEPVKKVRGKKGVTPSVPDVKTPDETPKTDDSTLKDAKGKKKKKKPDAEYEPSLAEKILIRPLLLLRTARLNYTEQLNSYVPGYLPNSRQFGMSELQKPGWDYVLGLQQADDNWLDNAGARSWISHDIRQVRPTLNNYTQQLDARLSVEPFQDFRVDIDLTKNYVRNSSQEYRDTVGTTGALAHTNRFQEGSYTISYFTVNTLFKNIDEVFQQFLDNRVIVSQRLNPTGSPFPDAPGFKQGYGPTNNDVLIPAFLAAYTGRDAKTVNRDLFKEKPSANWRLTYNGLAKLPGLRNVFTNISVTHSYKSTLTANSYRTSPFYDYNNITKPRKENQYDYYSQYDIPALVISEQFAPLIGIDASMKSGATFGIQYRKSRNLALSISDTRVQESKVSEIQVKFGHRIKNVYIKFLDFNFEGQKKADKKKKDEAAAADPPVIDPKTGRKKREPKPKKGNDLVLNFDLSFRDDQTKNHLFGQGVGDISSRGSQTFRMSPSATYTVNKRLDLRFYVDYNKSIPYTSASFPSTTATGGFVITFKLN